jgi:hypothetical protein
MDPKTRQQLLIAVIVLCLIAIAYWWYQSPYGPGGENKYGIIQVSWTNSAKTAGVGNLVIALSRSPKPDVKGGKVSSITSGLEVSSTTSLSAADAKTVESLLPKIEGQVIDSIDTGGNTITFTSMQAPSGWPALAGESWTVVTTTRSKATPTAYINVLPSSAGS